MENNKANKILEALQGKKVGVFCDDANLYHAYQKYGWRIDFRKFKEFLIEKCDLQFINYYIVIPAKNDFVHKGTQRFLHNIEAHVKLIKKELKYTPAGSQVIKKGNMDVEIVLDAVRSIEKLDVVIIVSGDSDFHELKNYVVKDKNKIIIFIGYEENMAWELRQCWHIYLNRIKEQVVLSGNKKAPSFISG